MELNNIIVENICLAYTRSRTDPSEIKLSKAVSFLLSSDYADQGCFHTVMSACVEMGHLEAALKIQKQMEAAGFPSNASTFRILSDECFNIGLEEYGVSFKNQYDQLAEREPKVPRTV